MTRHGKIGRLPKGIRDELNRRLANGEYAKRLVVWLNGLEEVQAVLKADFEGKPINEQNMTGWKQGGYVEWKQTVEVAELAKELRDKPERITQALGGGQANDYLATLMSVQLAELSQMFLDRKLSVEERWKRFCKVNEQLSRMRRDNHRELLCDY